MYRSLIVDDETLACREMRYLLQSFSEIEIVGEAASVPQAVKAIDELAPAVVFLDIQLGNESGFDLLEKTDKPYKVIFATAFDKYALRAFDVNALDYLLKPIVPERLREAVARLKQATFDDAENPGRLIGTDLALVRSGGRLRSVRVEEIVLIRASGDYTSVITVNGKELLIKRTMSHWHKCLPEDLFQRVHRSTIINLTQVVALEENPKNNWQINLHHFDQPISVSRRQTVRLRKLLTL